ncbi:MAG: carotenoid 1,2-hydratase [Deltaproteobacteria bacterium]|nr:carotenoid 1,2-hydratase [Deltaproteobacteria bacterium]
MNKMVRRRFTGMAVTLLVLLTVAGAPAYAREFSAVTPGYAFEFPKDHFSHENYRIEWWYFTGNVNSGGRKFGFELTFFRFGFNEPAVMSNPSAWAPKDLYPAHFAISDIENKTFFYAESIRRAALGRAGADPETRSVHNGSWEWRWGPEWILRAGEGDHAIDLRLKPLKGVVLHGDGGYSPKGESPEEASYYYSFTRLETAGTLRIGGRTFQVNGLSWMDHEFTSRLLNPRNQEGWDWFSIQLDNNIEIMLYLLRYRDSSKVAFGAGTLVHPDGSWTVLKRSGFEITPESFWRSDKSGGRYPVSWRIRIPDYGIDLKIKAAFSDQELITTRSTGVTYWEGSVTAVGRFQEQAVKGSGYAEMTGYAGAMKMGLGQEP